MVEVSVCLGQIKVTFSDVEGNLNRAIEAINEAARLGCRIIVLPETLDVGWLNPDARELAKPIPGPYSDALANAARANGIYVVAGLTEGEGGRVYDSAVLISPRGELLLKYRKINLLPDEQKIYEVGDRLGVAETEFGRVGVDICIDNAVDNLTLAHSMARMGASMILSPAGWAVPGDYDLNKEHYLDGPWGKGWVIAYTTIARLYDIAVIGVSSVGEMTKGYWSGYKLIGSSLAVGPGGVVLAKGREGVDAAEVIKVNVPIAPRPVKGSGWAQHLRERGYLLP